MKKQTPKPTLNRRLLSLAVLLVVLCAGLLIGSLVPGLVVLLVVVLLIVAGAVLFIAWDTWRKEYVVWASRPVRAARRVKETVQ